MGIYDLSFPTIFGEEIQLEDYKGKTLLLVNIASKCGFTSQLEDLQALYEKYQDKGLEIIGFPCNQFLLQSPESNEEFGEFCKFNYGVTFKLSKKIEVFGENAQPIFKYVTSVCPFEGFDMDNSQAKLVQAVVKTEIPEILYDDSVKWNFTKFLVSPDGSNITRFEPYVEPMDLEDDIKAMLA